MAPESTQQREEDREEFSEIELLISMPDSKIKGHEQEYEQLLRKNFIIMLRMEQGKMNDRENKEKFEREFDKLPVCPKCGAIKVKIKGEDSWRFPGDEDIYKTYKGYREMYGSHTREKLCRRCNPEYKGKGEWDGVERRRIEENE